MRKNSKEVNLVAVILFIVAGYIIMKIVWYSYQYHVLDNNRHEFFCETLEPGMSISEVTDILNATGDVIIRDEGGNSKFTYYEILFTDEKVQHLYGGWTRLFFVKGKYNGALMQEFDHYKEICVFGGIPNR